MTMTSAGNAPARLLQPATLAALANLDLVARTAVEGVLTGLHRSPNFGFSQEFKEYRAYAEGDDPRFIDWNVYARADRIYTRRFEGETNTRLMLLLDASASMGYSSQSVNKLQYAKFLAAAFAYLATRQQDPVGLIVFDEKIRQHRPPTSRTGSLHSLIHAIDAVQPGSGTDLAGCFANVREHLRKRGLVVVFSDLYCDPEQMTRAVQPLAYHGHDVMIVQILDPLELKPQWRESLVVEDIETRQFFNVSPDDIEQDYAPKLAAHLEALRNAAAKMGALQMLVRTDEPLDQALRRYLLFRQRHR
jgi:uncharacterized protein (DUF58 family)